MDQKIDQLLSRLEEVETFLGDPAIYSDQKKFKELSQEYSYLQSIQQASEELHSLKTQLVDIQRLLAEKDHDSDFRDLLEQEKEMLEEKIPVAETKLHLILVPPDPRDHRNTIVELRAGTGGDEAALFVADVYRMYRMYADRHRWTCEILSATPSDLGGFKEIVMLMTGKNIYRYMKFEGGTHRVQRVPETETQGRIHTSAMTVAILLEPEETEELAIDEKDLRIDTYRASGAGGQHINTTDSAVRITHLPSGVAAYCQEERSQHKNKEKAFRYLKAKLQEVEEAKKQKQEAADRSVQVGSGDRSERIRTYNFPQNRVTDHRINLTRYHLDRVLSGELEEFSEALLAYSLSKQAA